MEQWRPRDPTPPQLTPQSLTALINAVEASLTPASDEVYVRALAKLIEFATAFGLPAGDPEAVQRIYREKLADLPGDLLARAIVRVTDQWTWGNRLPMPAEIRATISGELTHRKVLICKAKVAMLKARDVPPPKHIVPPAVALERWADLRARLKSAAAKSARA